MAPLKPDACSRMRTWLTTAERSVTHDHEVVEHDSAGLDQLRAQPYPDPQKIAEAERGLDADRRQLSYDEKRLSDLQHKFDLDCGGFVP